jgi:hypothetical protein
MKKLLLLLKDSVTIVENGKTYGEQHCSKLKVYLGQQRNLV